jgi:hypothetical protein
MKKIMMFVLMLFLLQSFVFASEVRSIRCETTQDCIDNYGKDYVCVVGQNDDRICILAEGKMVVPEFTGPVLLLALVGCIVAAYYLIKKRKSISS